MDFDDIVELVLLGIVIYVALVVISSFSQQYTEVFDYVIQVAFYGLVAVMIFLAIDAVLE